MSEGKTVHGSLANDPTVERSELSFDRPMRILYLSQYFPPEPGAPAARVSELAQAWCEAGHDITVLTGMPNHPTGVVPGEYRHHAVVREQWGGVRVLRTWLYAAANRGKVRRSLSYASFGVSAVLSGAMLAAKPDVLIATSPQFLCAVAGHLVAASKRVPFVFEVRDLWPESIVAVGALPAGHPMIRGLELVEMRLYRRASKIVVVTDSFRERLIQRGVPYSKISVVKNGVDLARFVPQTRETKLRKQLGLGEDDFLAVYVGTHGMAHGLDMVLDAANRLRKQERIRFLFVGEGAERARLQARAKRERLERVRFLGALPRDEIPEVYASADVCLVPLRKSELFTTVLPSKIFEIFGMARPVLLSVDGEARRLVQSSGGGVFVPPGDSERMAESLSSLAEDRVRCEQMGQAGRRFVQSEFDRAKLAKDYLEVLEHVREQ